MLRVQKKLEPRSLYRLWVLVRVFAWTGWSLVIGSNLIPCVESRDFSPLIKLAGTFVALAVAWKIIEAFAETGFRWLYSKKIKKGAKGEKVPRLPAVRVFYRSTTLAHLFPGKPNPLLLALSEQDLEYSLWFRLYLTVRYVGYCVVGLITLLVFSAHPFASMAGVTDGVALIFAPFFALRVLESSLLYLLLGSVMSGEDIHGAKTTRFFAFEPTFSFVKKLTLPLFNRRAWFISLYQIRHRALRFVWWGVRISYVLAAVLFAQVASELKLQQPELIPLLLSVSLPFSIFYIGLVVERAVAYLAFFPAQKTLKKAGIAQQSPTDYQNVG